MLDVKWLGRADLLAFIVEVHNDTERTIPAGARDGTRIRLAGQGAPGAGDGQAGDLYVRLRIRPHPVYEREGDDLRLDLPVTLVELIAGAAPRFASDASGAPGVFSVRAGAVTWLPAAPLDPRAAELELPEDAWQRPFLVPRDAGLVRVLLLHRVESVGEAQFQALELSLADFGSVTDPLDGSVFEELREELRGYGFTVRDFLVHEPR